MKFYQSVVKILSENEILTLIKEHNSGRNVQKMTCIIPKVDLVNMKAYIFSEILSIGCQDIEQNLDVNQGP